MPNLPETNLGAFSCFSGSVRLSSNGPEGFLVYELMVRYGTTVHPDLVTFMGRQRNALVVEFRAINHWRCPRPGSIRLFDGPRSILLRTVCPRSYRQAIQVLLGRSGDSTYLPNTVSGCCYLVGISSAVVLGPSWFPGSPYVHHLITPRIGSS